MQWIVTLAECKAAEAARRQSEVADLLPELAAYAGPLTDVLSLGSAGGAR